MANELKMSCSRRTAGGSPVARRMRAQGDIPAVVYGHGKNINITLNLHDFSQLMKKMHSEHAVLTLDAEGEVVNVLIKEIQRHRATHNIQHVDFVVVDLDEIVTVSVPIITLGDADGVKNFGGIMEVTLREVEIQCKAGSIPDDITVDVSPLKLHEVLRVANLQVPEGVKILADPETPVVVISSSAAEDSAASEASGEAAAEEPEVITARKKEEEAEPEAPKGKK
ncbi:50S ribosomal protein L25 [bacterium]|nr:50S ribosomal protein L25 [bacterium]